ncbi:MAG: RimJ/RimL family protein N-acetyltransferase [Bacteriovoracaceae bacterium]|jgi:RimJ/RimL family protein N-acetyltransferase
MKITSQLLDPKDETLLKKLFDWETDPKIHPLITPVFKEEDQGKIVDFERFKARHLKSGHYVSEIFVLYADNIPVGNFSLMMDPGHLLLKEKGTAWLGLTIGESDYWGQGVAAKAMEFFEKRALHHKAKRIELGVFEFNHRAQRFYQKLGYKEIGRLEKFTWKDGQRFDDIRMEKRFT